MREKDTEEYKGRIKKELETKLNRKSIIKAIPAQNSSNRTWIEELDSCPHSTMHCALKLLLHGFTNRGKRERDTKPRKRN